ncbi:WhiB family transcriptional regulator [Kineococcus terrestris]|uniref:WhiB family transcriptional regulator n=1 Tax=Kineococcus terrestris TaxID=2044856 RepID=UPI0034DAEEA4
MSAWREQAACAEWVDVFDATFDGTYAGAESLALARAVCEACPVRRPCLRDALAAEAAGEPRYGVRGGLMPRERSRLQRASA